MTAKDKNSIFKEIQKINFSDYPQIYLYQHHDTVEAIIGTRCQKYFLTTTLYGISKLVEWNNFTTAITKDEKHEALLKLGQYIENIIWSGNPLKDYHPIKMQIDPN